MSGQELEAKKKPSPAKAKPEGLASLISPLILSCTHYLVLLPVKVPDERSFYEVEATNEDWSVPELKRQLDNGNAPTLPSLSEADVADAEGFLGEMLLCFPVLGVNLFTKTGAPPKNAKLLFITSKGIKAQGAVTADGFVVRAFSHAARDLVASCPDSVSAMRSALIANGVLKPASDNFVFTQDYLFTSPSTAAGVVQGRSANGRIDWRTSDGKTLKDLQEAEAQE